MIYNMFSVNFQALHPFGARGIFLTETSAFWTIDHDIIILVPTRYRTRSSRAVNYHNKIISHRRNYQWRGKKTCTLSKGAETPFHPPSPQTSYEGRLTDVLRECLPIAVYINEHKLSRLRGLGRVRVYLYNIIVHWQYSKRASSISFWAPS